MATSPTDLDFDGLTFNRVPWDTYCQLRDAAGNDHVRMTYLDGELTIAPGRVELGGLTLRNVGWKTYCRLRDDPAHDHVRMTYLDGTLTIMSPQARHEKGSRLLVYVITAVARAWRIRFMGVGTTTLRREGRAELRGASKEPDEGFCLGPDEAPVRHINDLDLTIHPPPNLAIEVDNTADSEHALPAYARIGVPEVWLYKAREDSLWFGRLSGDGYEEIGRSPGLPRLTPALVLEALAARDERDDLDWLDWLDDWARALPEPPEGRRAN